MATRSTIWIQNDNDNYDGVYCHWDGYPEHNGSILFNYYKEESKIRELISHGSLSVLDERIHPNPDSGHDFDNREDGVCCFYHRDRGDVLDVTRDLPEPMLRNEYQEYNYIFKDGAWYCNGSLLSEILEAEGVI